MPLRSLLLALATAGLTPCLASAQRDPDARADGRRAPSTLVAYAGIHHPTGELFPSSTGTPGVRTGNALLIGGRVEMFLARRAAIQVDFSHARPPLRYREEDGFLEGRANMWTMTARLAYHLLPPAGPVTMAVVGGAGLLQFDPEALYDNGETWETVVGGIIAGVRVSPRWTVVMLVENYLYRARSGRLRAGQHDLRAGVGMRLPL